MNNATVPSKSQILAKTNYGINIYAYILHKCFPNDNVVFSLSGRDCGTCRNPFNGGRKTLKIWIEKSAMPEAIYDEYAVHEDSSGTIPHGDVFVFAKLYYGLDGDELMFAIDRDLNLNISDSKGFYSKMDSDGREIVPAVKPIPMFSFYRAPISNITPYRSVTLLDIYTYIKGHYAKERTWKLRSIADAKQRRLYKAANFDYCTFSGVFVSRSDRNIIRHSGLMCLDFDHIANIEDVFNSLLADEYFETQMLFRSPSGDGLKWVVAIDDIGQTPHGEYFNAISCYIRKTYGIGIDSSGKDVSRACFLPYDPDAFINPKYL